MPPGGFCFSTEFDYDLHINIVHDVIYSKYDLNNILYLW